MGNNDESLVKGDDSLMNDHAANVKKFGEDLESALENIQTEINNFTQNNDKDAEDAGINGDSNDALFGTYNKLHKTLLEYVEEFKNVGQTVENKAEELAAMDSSHSTLDFC